MGTNDEQFTFFWRGPLSQWDTSPFMVDEILYHQAEHYMMAEKARLFGDRETWLKTFETTSAKAHKALGRQVRGFCVEIWEAHAREIVYKGNMAKFQQNQTHRAVLFGTRGTLVEASPVDQIWGIGLTAEDPRALRRETWLGRNWLGAVLTQVREDLLNSGK